MRLSGLCEGLGLRHPLTAEAAALDVRAVEYDSRRSTPGSLFFAFPGARADGRAFAAAALERGAVGVVSESPRPDGFAGLWLEVEHGRRALALAARRLYGCPDEALQLTGFTGTNGKTTSVWELDAVLRQAGLRTGLLGTVEYRIAEQRREAVNTTPESLDLVRLLAEMRQADVTHCSLEVSSHALALGRVYGLRFHTVVFSQLTRDHLDFHGDMERYFAAKQTLFDGAGGPPPKFAVVNHDDAYGRRLRTGAATTRLSYGLEPGADVQADGVAMSFAGLRFTVRHPAGATPVASPLTGMFNVYNLLSVFGAALSYGIAPETIAAGIAALAAVPGRFEKVAEGQPFLVVVDYAHTDDALKNALRAARALEPKRVLTLFGCGGDRDREKRPLMGQAAAEASDYVVVTSDNPRRENPLDIINDALVGVRRTDVRHHVEPDRAAAIRHVLEQAAPGDIVLLAGKGHETYQDVMGVKAPFDDREVARGLLRAFGYRRAEERP